MSASSSCFSLSAFTAQRGHFCLLYRNAIRTRVHYVLWHTMDYCIHSCVCVLSFLLPPPLYLCYRVFSHLPHSTSSYIRRQRRREASKGEITTKTTTRGGLKRCIGRYRRFQLCNIQVSVFGVRVFGGRVFVFCVCVSVCVYVRAYVCNTYISTTQHCMATTQHYMSTTQ